jgi:hypothetical protein
MVISAEDLVVTVTSRAVSVEMVTSHVASVVKVLKVVESALVVRSLRHHQSSHSAQSQSALSHVV